MVTQPYKLVSRKSRVDRTVICCRDELIGAGQLTLIAGPCSVESEEQIFACASLMKTYGVRFLRGGAFKPRSSPYSFQGLEEEGLKYLKKASRHYDLLSVSEVMDSEHIELVAEYIDIVQVGSRNMQNFSLLKKLGKIKNPILLKRGPSATYLDFLLSAEYILSAGNPNVILCERGIRTYETHTRNTLDLAAVPVLHELSHLPVIVDPSHGTGIRSAVIPMGLAAIAAGADGLMVEVHPSPENALSDGYQTIDAQEFQHLIQLLNQLAPVVGRSMKDHQHI